MNNNRNNNNNRRNRGRNNNRNQGGGNQANRIDNRARGNAPQMLDKYKKLAQDAQHNGDRVQAEYYLQFADHYFRVIADNKARQDEMRGKRQDERGDDASDDEAGDGDNRRNNNRRPRARRDDSYDAPGHDTSNGAGNGSINGMGDGGDEDRQTQNGRGRSNERGSERSERASVRTRQANVSEGAMGDEESGEDESVIREVKRPRKPRVAKPKAKPASSSDEIDASVLPPSIGASSQEAPAEKPKRVVRRKKPAADSASASASANDGEAATAG